MLCLYMVFTISVLKGQGRQAMSSKYHGWGHAPQVPYQYLGHCYPMQMFADTGQGTVMQYWPYRFVLIYFLVASPI